MSVEPDKPQQTNPGASGGRREYSDRLLALKLVGAFLLIGFLPALFSTLHIVSGYTAILNGVRGATSDPVLKAEITGQAGVLLHSIVLFSAIEVLLIVAGVFFAQRFLVLPVRQTLAWLRAARDRKFIQVPPLPTTSADETGALGYEIEQSIRYFQEAEERQKEISREKSQFIGVTAHQLRTPLTGIKWGIEAFIDTAKDPKKQREMAEDVVSSVERMIRLVDDVLNVAKIEEGKFGDDLEEADLVAPLRKLVEEFQAVVKARGIALEYAHAENVLRAFMDTDRIVQAVSNLLSNALGYTPRGGTVRLELAKKGRRVRISVRDTGIGLSEEERGRVFTRFYRGERAKLMQPDGSGLGLYIVRNIARRHGSDVSIESQPDKGSMFSFSVPLTKQDLGSADVSVEKFFASF